MARPSLPKGTRFEVSKEGNSKYISFLHNGRRVRFGHKEYEQYRDSVPKAMGGGKWSRKDHNDPKRRESFLSRAAGQKCADGKRCIDVKFSPAWFSYYYLW
jgi:hypothetical protein